MADLFDAPVAVTKVMRMGGDGKQYDVTPAAPKDAHFIGRCVYKGCKCRPVRIAVRMENHVRVKDQMWLGPKGYQVAYSYVTGEWKPAPNQPYHSGYDTSLHCIFHRHPLGWKMVNGTYSERHKCNAKCTGAIGPDCECSCGGANHGADWDPDNRPKLISLK